MHYMVGLVLFIRFMVGHVLCAIPYGASMCGLQAVTPTRLKPFLSRLWMRTAPSKRIARAREHAIAKGTRYCKTHARAMPFADPCATHCAPVTPIASALAFALSTVQTYCLITRISRNAYA